MTKRIYKSNTNKVISGVCGGVAEYFNIDPSIVRLVWFISLFMGGTGFFLYIGAAIILPSAPWVNMTPPPYNPGTDWDNTHNNGNGPPR